MKWMTLLMFLVSNSLFAAESQDWRVGSSTFKVVKLEPYGWVVNSHCADRIAKKEICIAVENAKKASFKKITPDMRRGGKNPGSILCKSFSKAQVFIASDSNGNQNSFCMFEDHSLISNGSLGKAARDNDSR